MCKEIWKPGNMLYPVPAVMVSCMRPGERPDIVTVAWAGTINSDPPMLSISLRPSRFSHDIIRDTGEFAVNLVNRDLAKACDWCGVKSGRDVDKFREMHLTEYVSEFMETPAIAESPVNLYCEVTQILPLGSHDLFLGKIKGVTVSGAYMDESGRFDLAATDLIAYSHGEYYALGDYIGKFGYSVQKKKK
ncbi:MAG: flavin reductase family protein [Lachnospiraceae bacterium]|nr:flavin reductase family protein [Lachnospiraceae bacterium]